MVISAKENSKAGRGLWHGLGDQLYILCCKDFVYLFLEKGRVWEREGEKHQSVASHMCPDQGLGTEPTTQACALTGNWTSNLLLCMSMPKLSHSDQGRELNF